MRPYAKINGIPVFTNKEVKRVVDGRVVCADGSWCDVGAGEIVLRGKGFLTIGQAPEGEEDASKLITWGPERYNVKTVSVEDVDADVVVELSDDEFTYVEMEGCEDDLKRISVEDKANGVYIVGKKGKHKRGIAFSGNTISAKGDISIHTGNNGSTRTTTVTTERVVDFDSFVALLMYLWGAFLTLLCPNRRTVIRQITTCEGSQSIVITGGSEKTKITVKVPKHLILDLERIDGKILVGDTEGEVNLRIEGINSAKLGVIGKAIIHSSSSGTVAIQCVQGTLSATLTGIGSVKIAEGDLTNLTVTTHSSGSFKYDGQTQKAQLTSLDIGGICINEVNGPAQVVTSGSGKIEILSGVVTDLKATLNNIGGISVEEVNGPIMAESSGSGSIKIHSGVSSHLVARATNIGAIKFHGRAMEANLSTDGSGNIEVQRVSSPPVTHRSGIGKIIIREIG